MKNLKPALLMALLFFCSFSAAQKVCPCLSDTVRVNSLRLCFYNCENYFDTFDDSLKNDNEFLPGGSYHWDNKKFYHKSDQLAKVILAMGGWKAPEIVGVAEVENEYVLKYLVRNTALKKSKYSYIHYDSPDPRGIDVALLYRPDYFKVLYSEAIPIHFYGRPDMAARDILYVKGCAVGSKDTLHIFVNHFTSRFGGYTGTMWKRNYMASVLKSHIDSIRKSEPSAAIISVGDFNDTQYDSSLSYYLKAELNPEKAKSDALINLMYVYSGKNQTGTLKYHRNWSIFDHIIVTPSMLNQNFSYRIADEACIFYMDFMMEDDEKYLGKKPSRTYVGRKYNGGFSDHLPVLVDIEFK